MSDHPVFWLMVVAVAAPLLAEIPLGVRVPIVVLEVLLGVVIGPEGLDLVRLDGFVKTMHGFGMAITLFMAGMELDFDAIRGRPLALATGGWALSVLLGLTAVGLLHVMPQVRAPLMVTLATCTTGLGVLIPVFRDSGQLATSLGRMVLAAGALGEVGPIVAMSLLLSTRYSTWQELGFLVLFLAIVGAAIALGIGVRPPRLLDLLARHLHTSTQLPVRISLLILGGLFLLADHFGFESIFGAFAAGMIIGQVTRGARGRPFRDKLDAVAFGWFYPFFFIGTGIKFNVAALGADLRTLLLVPAFVLLFLFVRGAPALLLYRRSLATAQRWPLALASAVPSLSIVVVMTEIGVKSRTMNHDIATAMIGAALLSLLLFPTIAGALMPASADQPAHLDPA
jgi:Kef-type K+ transport system membrane component KefB